MITVTAITMFDTTVSQPALKLTAVLENEPAWRFQETEYWATCLEETHTGGCLQETSKLPGKYWIKISGLDV